MGGGGDLVVVGPVGPAGQVEGEEAADGDRGQDDDVLAGREHPRRTPDGRARHSGEEPDAEDGEGGVHALGRGRKPGGGGHGEHG